MECIYEYCGMRRKCFDLPPRCFKCSLAEIQPSQIRNQNGHWPNEALALFERLTTQKLVEIEVNHKITGGSKNDLFLMKSSFEGILGNEWNGKSVHQKSRNTRKSQ